MQVLKGWMGQSFTARIPLGIALAGSTLVIRYRTPANRLNDAAWVEVAATVYDSTYAQATFAADLNIERGIWEFQAIATFAGSPTRIEPSDIYGIEMRKGSL